MKKYIFALNLNFKLVRVYSSAKKEGMQKIAQRHLFIGGFLIFKILYSFARKKNQKLRFRNILAMERLQRTNPLIV